MKKLFFLFIIAVIAVAAFLLYRNKPQVQKFEKTTHSAIEKTQQAVTNAVQEGAQKAGELKTNAVTEVKAGMKQANQVATNAVAQVKEATTNAIHQAKEAVGATNQ